MKSVRMFEQMRGLTPKQKIEYYIQYYGAVTLVIAAAVIAVASFIVQRVRAKDEAAGVIVINSASALVEESEEQAYMDDLLASLDIDPAGNTIIVNDNLFIGDTTDMQMSVASIQMLQALIMSRSVDVAFTDEGYRDAFMSNECLGDLRSYLDEELLEKYADDLVYYTDPETGEEIAAMIRIPADSAWIRGMSWYVQDCYAGIIVSTEHEEIAVHMLLRALGEEACLTKQEG